MSARRRGQARGNAGGNAPDGSNQQGRRGPNPNRGRVAPFDGPASRGSGSGGGAQSLASGPQSSRAPSQPGSNAGQSQTSAPSQPAQQVAAPVARDPALETSIVRATDSIRNVDMPASFYNIDGLYSLPTDFAKRPGFNTTGKTINLPVNSHAVTQLPTAVIFQYDVVIGNGAEKRVVQAKVWDSQKRKTATGVEIVYDGNKLAWSTRKLGQIKAMVDLDEEEGKGPSRDGKNAFRIHISQTKTLDPTVILAYLQGRIQFNTNVLEAVNFMDHLLREGPSRNADLVAVKRSFFKRQGQKQDLAGGVEVWRGVYQSMRVAQGGRMIINLDVSNTTFWIAQALVPAISQKIGLRDPGELTARLRDANQRKAITKFIKKLSVKARYTGNKQPNTVWKIEAIAEKNPTEHMITMRDPQTGQPTNERISVAVYFKRKYNVTLSLPQLPMIQMTKKMKGEPIYFPMELLVLTPFQRYGAKLDEKQTANMIKFAVSPPPVRQASIREGKDWLNWDKDPHIKNYGLQINNQPIVTQARILPPPGVRFGNKVEQPGLKGRWDLRGKHFLKGNSTELTSWGIGMFRGRTRLETRDAEKFAMDFVKQYKGHGGRVAPGLPHIMSLKNDAGQAVADLYQATGNKFQKQPELLIFFLQDRNSFHYERIKKSCDCRYGVLSQCMQAAQVQKGNPQYYSNVLMKVNAKLGGATAQVAPANNSAFSGKFSSPPVFIGADVSHSSPGSDAPSLAAITLSFDAYCARYAAGVETNGRRVEMITEKNWYKVLGPLLSQWTTDVGSGKTPSQVYYIRDGVSEGQFIKVIQEEVPHIRGVLNKLSGNGKWEGKITVLVASKRHHIRAFPTGNDGDLKGNPVPGTLIEKDVTMPQEFDFFLYSHIALQGTSRPVHYTVLLDEGNHSAGALQNMIYEHCYQYMRSTTSVSQHPAAYYAHLAAKRAVSHVNVPAAAGPQTGAGMKANQPSGSSDTPRSSEVPPLLEMYNQSASKIKWSMWYI